MEPWPQHGGLGFVKHVYTWDFLETSSLNFVLPDYTYLSAHVLCVDSIDLCVCVCLPMFFSQFL